jgi:radical SAM-linked protein
MPENIAVSLPSLRVGTLNPEIMKQIQRVRKTGFTLAPEAGSERLRRVINKGITEHDLIDTAAHAYKLGWSNIKLYFMTGLPTETMADVLEIAKLVKRVLASGGKRGRKVTVSVSTFVPKPHTPFQWERQLNVRESKDRLGLLRSNLKGRDLHYKWHDPLQSFVEGVFSRGDRRLIRVLYRAWKMGARLDAWNDYLMPDLYRKAALEEDIELEKYIKAIDTKAPLPWGHILTGVSNEYLLDEREKSRKETYTPDCRHGECQTCGVCDFKHIRPVIYEEEKVHTSSLTQSPNHPITYHLTFSKLGEARFLGHLELVHAFHRAARRAHIPVAYSQGFHPKPRFSFGQPIPLGTESMAEQFAIRLIEYVKPDRLKNSLSGEMPQGITISSVELVGPKTSLNVPELVKYLVYVPGVTASQVEDSIKELNSTPKWPVRRIRKGKEITTDLKQVVESLQSITRKDMGDRHMTSCHWPEDVRDEETPYFYLTLRSIARFNLKPAEVIGSILGLSEEMMKMLRILKSAFSK